MELMSSLLFCALAMLPWTLGVPRSQIKQNNSLMLNQKQTSRKKVLLNINGPPLVNAANDLQSVFKDNTCRDCISCMEKAIKAHKTNSYIIGTEPNDQETYYELMNNRNKRDAGQSNGETKIKQGKSNTATITKYTKEDGKLFAIEVKGTDGNEKNTCKVYSVKKTLPCDAESYLSTVPKRKTKRSKKSKDKTVFTTEREESLSSTYKKRDVDNSQVQESFMPSIEDLY